MTQPDAEDGIDYHCGHPALVKDSRVSGRLNHKRRRRECQVCEERYTTYEILASDYITLVAKAQRLERIAAVVTRELK